MYYEEDRDFMHSLSSESATGCLLSWGIYRMTDAILIKKKNYSAFLKMPVSMYMLWANGNSKVDISRYTYVFIFVFTNGFNIKKITLIHKFYSCTL